MRKIIERKGFIKWLALLLSIMLVGVCFVACGIESQNDVVNNSTDNELTFDRLVANPGFLYGDFTGDGYVDAIDVLWIGRYIESGCDLEKMLNKWPWETKAEPFNEAAADFTGNGIIDEIDVIWIRRYIASGRDVNVMIEAFPPDTGFGHLVSNP